MHAEIKADAVLSHSVLFTQGCEGNHGGQDVYLHYGSHACINDNINDNMNTNWMTSCYKNAPRSPSHTYIYKPCIANPRQG